jgi:hypothetical protein
VLSSWGFVTTSGIRRVDAPSLGSPPHSIS